MKFITYIEQFNLLSVFIRLLLSTVLGSLIGIERGSHGQAAGVRTFSIVCLGAAMTMITDEYIVSIYNTGDPARLSAQVISGIGFLGAGAILVTGKNSIRGLTTAASLWSTACLGIIIGSGYIVGALIAFLMIGFIMIVLTPISHYIEEHIPKMCVYLEVDRNYGLSKLYEYTKSKDIKIISVEKQQKQSLKEEDTVLIITFNLQNKICHTDIIAELNNIEYIHYIEEMR